ncbi:MAG: N-acetyl-1-D-myo-inositol-2-amino-2-deoxy-alpha-D-glucopyranoside deacetylase [Actinomycetota bacterium]|nr:N-acetyl-1-D-myo-inositol-2-amino-2-deoxy-alpha-D-glucopyranoside deacetylase [Micrococcales bacterium]MEC7103749.1 N-acetyl-1-D-myo-inositol-2-amino-2-deoxy-alpha-D-glucopyranoside deacetylase [Actinomycetota bacterium]MEC8445782.1 N-acetyl-1-D-myo-inositol-2-amino-2-deoxy-alpha-D-glucopyranoside deacetylase [Actinomycetota bacterium]MEC8648455.1 N-acetyl-1-D-myo-inositol-2-amino-2-deoxy-alpha-D-glucopyranoside deacetylase [Actinomycetota bacterium]MED5527795.1 N-acetyl-1-D-myo-inositol-2-a|tara:strand:- start:807 stop:1697 length:891 start_codon:yes stop_codon:yes gene_type:complete
MTTPDRRLLLVHAHPDDETIGTGAVMAKYVTEGVQVTLVTCTLGEEGEVLVPELQHLAADQEDSLGEHRIGELADAMAILGVSDHRFLGGAGTYRDSGMMGVPSNDRDDCFWRADLLAAACDLVQVIREIRPQVVVTYDDFGGYGHPDHIQAHRVTHYAVALAESPSFRSDFGPAWGVSKVYWTAFPRSVIREGIMTLREVDSDNEFAAMDPDDLPFACDDELITTAVDATEFLDTKMTALAAHKTQVTVDGGFFALSNNLGSQAMGTEYFRLVRGTPVLDTRGGRETDLFAGIGE